MVGKYKRNLSLACRTGGEEITNKIRGISISSHTVSMLPIDADGNPVRNAMTYQDNRSSKELDTILQKIGEEEFIQIVGGQPSVSFLPSKILWFKTMSRTFLLKHNVSYRPVPSLILN